MAAKMFAMLDEKFARTYPLSLLLSSPTIRQLAEHYDRPVETLRKLTSLVPLRSRGSLPPVFAVPGVFGNVLGYVELARELGEDQPFYALQAVGLDGLQSPFATIEANANEEGHLYGSVGSPEISRSLKGKNLKVEPEMIHLEGAVKQGGLYEVDLNLGYDITTKVKVMVVPLKQPEKK